MLHYNNADILIEHPMPFPGGLTESDEESETDDLELSTSFFAEEEPPALQPDKSNPPSSSHNYYMKELQLAWQST